MRSYVMNTVVNAWKYDMHVLQDCNVEWKTEIGMRPFMNLLIKMIKFKTSSSRTKLKFIYIYLISKRNKYGE
jgi:hypothetical protein